jgi:hypothetical protein
MNQASQAVLKCDKAVVIGLATERRWTKFLPCLASESKHHPEFMILSVLLWFVLAMHQHDHGYHNHIIADEESGGAVYHGVENIDSRDLMTNHSFHQDSDACGKDEPGHDGKIRIRKRTSRCRHRCHCRIQFFKFLQHHVVV